jgi:threonine dehydratase
VWVKHENHTPIGSFKVRGGLFMTARLVASGRASGGLLAATRGNFGQSVAFAARRHGLTATVVVPRGNSREKNAAMRAHGATLVEHGSDFQESYEHALQLGGDGSLTFVPSFDPLLVQGVATYGVELFEAVRDLDAVYVPIGLGSGACGVIAARNAVSPKTAVIGVVSEALPTYQLSFAAGEPRPTPPGETIADGMATRVPDERALEIMGGNLDRMVALSEAQIEAAMRAYFVDTHNVAEGAGAAALAALLAESEQMRGKRVAVVLSGGNIDTEVFCRVLAGSR